MIKSGVGILEEKGDDFLVVEAQLDKRQIE